MPEGKLIIFSAPSGAGKTTIVHRLLQSGIRLEFSVSAASRAKRANETDGKDYYFLSPETFREKIANNEFLEWEEVYQNQYYGTLLSEINRIWNNGNHVIFDVDVVGGLNIKQKYREKALTIFVKPPTVEILEQRLRNRSTEDEESLQKRISKARWELEKASEFDVIIVNDDLEIAVNEAIEKVKAFIES